jgi:hypothetical protein
VIEPILIAPHAKLAPRGPHLLCRLLRRAGLWRFSAHATNMSQYGRSRLHSWLCAENGPHVA